MNFKTVLLDLDDTLVIEEKSAYHSFLAAANYLKKMDIDPDDFVRTVRSSARELWYSLPTIRYATEIGISSWEALWAEFSDADENQTALKKQKEFYRKNAWNNALLKFGIVDGELALKLSQIYCDERRERHILFDDTEEFLDKLQDLNLKLALITNGTPDLQRQKIDKSGIGKRFREIVISGEFGVKKPGKEIFNHCLLKLNETPDNAVMIGDTLESDIKGANETGITSVWLNRNSIENKTDIQPKYEIKGLMEAIQLIYQE